MTIWCMSGWAHVWDLWKGRKIGFPNIYYSNGTTSSGRRGDFLHVSVIQAFWFTTTSLQLILVR